MAANLLTISLLSWCATPSPHSVAVRSVAVRNVVVRSVAGRMKLGDGLPSIQTLAARQRTAAILMENWSTVSERLGTFSGDAVEARTSTRHGVGLFALRDLEAGDFVALHPVHRVLQPMPDGQVAGAIMSEEDDAYFRSSAGVSDDEFAYRQVAYGNIYSHVDPNRPEAFLLDANPTQPDIAGWLAHRINDGAVLSPGASDTAIADYYQASSAARNVCAVALCVPLLGFVTTAPIAAGEELLATCACTRLKHSDPPKHARLAASSRTYGSNRVRDRWAHLLDAERAAWRSRAA